MAAVAEVLEKGTIFRDLPKRAIKRIERLALTRTFNAGQVVVKEGDEGVGFFLITEGKVDISRAGKHLNTLSAGDFFGEMALLNLPLEGPAVASSTAKANRLVLRDVVGTKNIANPDLAV